MVQQALGSLPILFWMFVIGFFTTSIGMYVLAVIVALLVWFYSWLAYVEHEPWMAEEPNKFGLRQVLAKGHMDQGHFILTREKAPGGNYVYPYILTLSVFDRQHNLVSSVAKIISRAEDDGRFLIGTYRGRDIVINSDHWTSGRFHTFGGPNAHDTWRVYPEQPDVPFHLKNQR